MRNEPQKDTDHLNRTVQNIQDKKAVQQLLQSDDTKQMMDMLGSRDQVKSAAKAAAAGDPAALMDMMQRLMSTKEGAQLVERITDNARKSGL